MPIHVLAPGIAARIAAGEVVERPASAVKELVENALDAGATSIRVEVTGGGLDTIRVVDDGAGIPAAEAHHLFQRHATSKLSSADDLDRVATLGFRGEALHSLAAVAEVEVLTRSASDEAGVRLMASDGRLQGQSPHGTPRGAAVTIRRLFRDVPARRKFLRSPQGETSRIQAAILPYVLAFPGVRFTLVADGRTSISSPGDGTLREAVAAVYGGEVGRALLEMSGDAGGVAVEGLVSPPDLHRANRTYISLYVNRRPVQSRSLAYAAVEAYQGFLPVGRSPIAVLFVTVPYDEVDVNVHPAKAEVRLSREREVFGLLQRAVREAVVARSPVPQIASSAWGGTARAGPSDAPPILRPIGPTHSPALGFPPPPAPDGVRASDRAEDATDGLQGGLLPVDALPALRVLGQAHETYIVAEGPDGLYLIDQHAAHERVIFERLKRSAARREPDIQGLLEPVVEELTPLQDELVHEQGSILTDYGWVLEPFGTRSYLVRGVPSVLARRPPAQAFLDLLDGLLEASDVPSWEDRVAATVACHGSVRAGGSLSRDEMMAMVRDLERSPQPHTCPHGRPTMVHLSASHLERQFLRR